MSVKTRIFLLFLSLILVLPLLASCGGGNAKETTPGKETKTESETSAETKTETSAETKTETENWEDVDFTGETLRINVSVAVNPEQTFGAADVYSRGPDSLGAAKDEVEKKVFDRNRNLEDTLHLAIEWQETDEPVGSCHAVIENFVRMDPDNAPDIFINDTYDLMQAMLNQCLWNLMDDRDGNGNELKNYIDLGHECWYREFMRGSSIRGDKIYLASGNAFLDMLRYAYVIYVNRGMFDEVMAGQYITVHELYEDVLAGLWDYDIMSQYIEIGWLDTEDDGFATDDDERVGFIASSHIETGFTWSCGLSLIQWEDGEKYNGKPYIPENNQAFFDYVDAFCDFFYTPGILYDDTPFTGKRHCVELFIEGRALFALSMLGELEAEDVRRSDVNKGVLPLPKYDTTADYFTLVHDQAEIACIANNARHFTEATAYLQRINELSTPVLKEYYENALKLRYNDDPDTKAMIDLIHSKMGTPFDIILTNLVVSGTIEGANELPGAAYHGKWLSTQIHEDAAEGKSSFNSFYASSFEGWRQNLDVLVALFEEME